MPNRRNVKSRSKWTTDQHGHDKDFLTVAEIDRLSDRAKAGRHGVRNHLMVMMMYRHGRRFSEAITIWIKDIDCKRSRLWVRRLNNRLSVEQPIPGDELRAIRRCLNQREDRLPWLFLSEREQPMTRRSVSYIVENAAARARTEYFNSIDPKPRFATVIVSRSFAGRMTLDDRPQNWK